MQSERIVPVITVDGPSGTGKGTLSRLLANELGWHYLDSGALYRVLALAALEQSMPLDNEAQLAELARFLPVAFHEVARSEHVGVFLGKEEVTTKIRTEGVGNAASQVAQYPSVRQALVKRQLDFRQSPGLVADGRDMGTVIFPDAPLKVFLDASVAERALRRFRQLKKIGISGSLEALFTEINGRDKRDRERVSSPLVPAAGAVIIDTTDLSVDQLFVRIRALLKERGLDVPSQHS